MTDTAGLAQPRVTYVIYAFNEEAYVREAVASALTQTHSPLEIVLSDDASTDRTFEIMQAMASAYVGPHKIILNHFEANSGIGGQINAAYQRSCGELVVLANADDVAEPNRVARVVGAWLAGERRATAITHDLATIDERGAPLSRVIQTDTVFGNLEDGVRRRFSGVAAASLALSRSVFDRFGPLHPNLILEDNALYLRAVLLGERIHLNETLVRYRIHRGNISQAYAVDGYEVWRRRHHERLIWQKRESVKAYLQMLSDLHADPAVAWEPADLARARWAGMEKLMSVELDRAHYVRDAALPPPAAWTSIARLSWQLVRLAITRRLPWLRARSDRWHYQRMLEAAEER